VPVIGVGIVGTGGIARAHAEAYTRFADRCRLVAVADLEAGRAEAFARGQAGAVEGFSRAEDVLARRDVDLVSICTPPFTHASLAVAALQAGKHVLVEKPMATSLQECDAMLAAARSCGRSLGVVHQNRFRPEFARCRALLDAGLLGPLDLIGVHCLWWRGAEYYRLWWRGTWEKEGGGALLNHAVHFVDLMVWLAGLPLEVCGLAARRAHDVEVEDLACALLRFPGGALGQLTGTVAAHLDAERFEVCGRRAAVSVVPWGLRAMVDRGDGFGRQDPAAAGELERAAAAVAVSPHRGHAAQIDLVLEALRRGAPQPVGGEDGRRAVEVVTAVYAAAAAGRPCALPLPPTHPFHGTEGLRAGMRGALGGGV
jgi:UDP-N-acetyl-2-amino-2-deoxyglucuronate dehydrogenase